MFVMGMDIGYSNLKLAMGLSGGVNDNLILTHFTG